VTLQYFATEDSIFGFERNAKTFILTLCILVLVLPLLAYAVDHVQNMCTAWIERLGRKKRWSRSHNMDVELSHPDLLGLDYEPYSEKRRP